jgi:alcohol dehydrogenase class IV
LATQYSQHHGLCTALALPYGLAYNLPALGEKRATLLEAMGIDASASDDEVVDRVRSWLVELGLPTSLAEIDVHDPDVASLAEETARMTLLPNSPRPASVDDCQRILESMV